MLHTRCFHTNVRAYTHPHTREFEWEYGQPDRSGRPVKKKKKEKKRCCTLFTKDATQMAMRSNSWESWKVCDPIIKAPQSVHKWLIEKEISVPQCITLHICADIMKSPSIVIKILIRCFNIFSKAKKEAVHSCFHWLVAGEPAQFSYREIFHITVQMVFIRPCKWSDSSWLHVKNK